MSGLNVQLRRSKVETVDDPGALFVANHFKITFDDKI